MDDWWTMAPKDLNRRGISGVFLQAQSPCRIVNGTAETGGVGGQPFGHPSNDFRPSQKGSRPARARLCPDHIRSSVIDIGHLVYVRNLAEEKSLSRLENIVNIP